MPPVSIRSFQPVGTPARSPGSSPRAMAPSTAAASALARSSVTSQTAPMPSSRSASAPRCSWSTSAADAWPERTSSAIAVASRTGEPRHAEALAVGGERAALGQISGQATKQGAELEGVAAVTAQDDAAVDDVEHEVSVGGHGVETRLLVHRLGMQPGKGPLDVVEQTRGDGGVDRPVVAIGVEFLVTCGILGDLIANTGCRDAIPDAIAVAVIDQRGPAVARAGKVAHLL